MVMAGREAIGLSRIWTDVRVLLVRTRPPADAQFVVRVASSQRMRGFACLVEGRPRRSPPNR